MDPNWKTKNVMHEGYPLFLRYPAKLDYTSKCTTFPQLAVVTHHFSKVTGNGLPDADYNDALFAFDTDLRDAFENTGAGHTVLVESFAGKRNYYIYVSPDVAMTGILSGIATRYPEHKITWLVRSDPTWGFIQEYAKEYL